MDRFLITDSIIVPTRYVLKVVPGTKKVDGEDVEGTWVLVENRIHGKIDNEFVPESYEVVREAFIDSMRD